MTPSSRNSISFIIPAYNCAETVGETVESIFNGNFSAGDEAILINDCSSDNTAEVLSALQAQYPAIRILNHRVNKGTAAASRNTGIEQSNNDLIFCLDADNVLVPDSVPKLTEHLLATKADAAAFGEMHVFNHATRAINYKWIFRAEITLADALAGFIWPGPSGNYLFTKQSWLKAGRYFEPTLLNQTIDSWAFGISQLGTGSKMVTLPETYYLHRNGIQSHYVREYERGNQSLAALVALLPFLELLHERDVEYIMGRRGRMVWYSNLAQRPLHLKNGALGRSGTSVNFWKERPPLPPLTRRIVLKAKSLISAFISPAS
ncbi:MAG: glycosyltransferase family 2 protein [Chloroflexi bacterium]|nr:glycosyltransferase family 2 protein [Chloroflexota bacterium]